MDGAARKGADVRDPLVATLIPKVLPSTLALLKGNDEQLHSSQGIKSWSMGPTIYSNQAVGGGLRTA